MSPANDAPYYDTIITSERKDYTIRGIPLNIGTTGGFSSTNCGKYYTIRGMPLNPLIELIHGITEPKPTKFNNDYEYKFVGIPNPFNMWERRYLAKWLIEDDKFFLIELEGDIYGVTLTPHTFFIRHNLASGSAFKQLATWYTGTLITYSEEKIIFIEQQKFEVCHRITYQIEKGIVLSSESKTFQEKYVELPF